MSEALLIGLIGSTLAIVMGVNLAHMLTRFAPHTYFTLLSCPLLYYQDRTFSNF
jgi:hypothetical protein